MAVLRFSVDAEVDIDEIAGYIAQSNTRSFPIGRYMIFYQVVTGGIEILRVLHSARDVTGL